MAREIRTFAVTIPANTPQATPAVIPVVFPQRQVVQLDWQVPPGNGGRLGWALTIGGAPVIPRNPGAFIIADNVARSWPLEGFPDQGQWQVTGYNTDIYDHTVYLDFLLELVTTPLTSPAQIPNALLSSTPAPVPLLAAPALLPALAGA